MSPAHMNAKPAKGTAAKARRARRRRIEMAELLAKADAKQRDGYLCRRCGNFKSSCEAAHIDDKQMGGDHGLHSSLRSDYVTLCHDCHQGPRGLHSGRLRLIVGPKRGDGPVSFEPIGEEQSGRN